VIQKNKESTVIRLKYTKNEQRILFFLIFVTEKQWLPAITIKRGNGASAPRRNYYEYYKTNAQPGRL